MRDIEELLVRTLHDERRTTPVSPGTTQTVVRLSHRLKLQRRLGSAAAALVAVAAVAGGTMLADSHSARDGRAPSYDASVSAHPRTS